jgi:hypothetical protein
MQLMRKRLQYLVPLAYLIVFGLCLFRASAFAEGGFDWFGACMALTLPWSILTFFFIMGAMRLTDDNGVLMGIAFTALLNAGLLFLLFRPRQRNKTN